MDAKNILTVAFPVFERYDFFEKSLDSVINQTIKCNILVVDNASSHTKFKDFCKKREIEYIRNDSNIGLFPNWNKCMASIPTKYGMIFQDDNIMKPNFVEEFMNSVKSFPEIEFYYTNFDLLHFKTNIYGDHAHIFPWGFMKNGKKIIEYGIEYELGLPYSFIVEVSKFSPYYTLKHGSNDWLWIYTKTEYLNIFGNKKKLFTYGIHDNQDSKNNETKKDVFISIAYIYNYLSINSESRTLSKRASKLTSKYIINYLLTVDDNYLNKYKVSNDIYSDFFRAILNLKPNFKLLLKLNKYTKLFIFKVLGKYYYFTKYKTPKDQC